MSRSHSAVLLSIAIFLSVAALLALSVGAAPAVVDDTQFQSTDDGSAADTPTDGGDHLAPTVEQSQQEGTERTDPQNVSPSSPLRFEDATTESGTAVVSAEAGVVTGSGLSEIEARYNEHLLDERLETATTDAAQRSAVRTHQDIVSQRVQSLRARERAAYQEYHAGQRTDAELLYEIAYIHQAAGVYQTWVEHTRDRTEETPGLDPGEEIGALTVESLLMQGPVRGHASEATLGVRENDRVYVTAAQRGMVLSTNRDGEYIREAYDEDRYQRNANFDIDEVEALERVDEQYPWITEFDDVGLSRNFQTPSIQGGTYVVGIEHPHGALTTYVNTESGDVYREHQRLGHESIPTEELTNTTQFGLRLVVEETYPTGPAKITLLDEQSGQPLQGEVRLDNSTIGTTNSDGVVWTVLPPGETEVTGVVGGDQVTVFVGEPQQAPGQNEDEQGSTDSSDGR